MLIIRQLLKRDHLASALILIVACTALQIFQPCLAEKEHRIGFGLRPQYTYLHTNFSSEHLSGLTMKTLISRESVWGIGIGFTSLFNDDTKIFRLGLEHDFIIGKYWGVPEWRLLNMFGFDLLIQDKAGVDRGGVHVGSNLGYRLPWNLFDGFIDVTLGGFYSSFSNNVKGYGVSFGVLWIYSKTQ